MKGNFAGLPGGTVRNEKVADYGAGCAGTRGGGGAGALVAAPLAFFADEQRFDTRAKRRNPDSAVARRWPRVRVWPVAVSQERARPIGRGQGSSKRADWRRQRDWRSKHWGRYGGARQGRGRQGHEGDDHSSGSRSCFDSQRPAPTPASTAGLHRARTRNRRTDGGGREGRRDHLRP